MSIDGRLSPAKGVHAGAQACGNAAVKDTHCVQSRPRNTKRPSFRNFTIAFGKLVQADKHVTAILVATSTGVGFCMLLASALALHPIALSVQPKPFSLARVTIQSRLKRRVSASSRPRQDNLQALCRPQRPTQPSITGQDSPELAWHLILAATVASPLSASAAEINYTPGQGADVVKNIGGLAYVGLLAFWLFKVVGRRIKRSTTEAGQLQAKCCQLFPSIAPAGCCMFPRLLLHSLIGLYIHVVACCRG